MDLLELVHLFSSGIAAIVFCPSLHSRYPAFLALVPQWAMVVDKNDVVVFKCSLCLPELPLLNMTEVCIKR